MTTAHYRFCHATLLLVGAGFATLTQAAAPSGYSPAYDSCISAVSTTRGMIDCAAAETRLQDARLNANYQSGIKALDAGQRTAMRDVQRLWIRFRDADCALAGSLTGGSIDHVNAQMCLLQATKARADLLGERFGPQAR
ncbi:lysozyme inhibitor LprI family protein [Pseudomonas sp. dw_358]|uniref:lysozyme inhibitor LprI family protein n=1 Tax=Pseudomonas sp. dw_358 TaxID=2720083 RepID=UPI001BD522D7|nr:lysozyme inhibitor LprI family protein [Pseudomonas sp. dw_358]